MPSVDTFHTSADPRLPPLLAWFAAHDVRVGDGVRISTTNTAGAWGVIAARALPPGALVAEIPKKALLSVQTTGIADILAESQLTGASALAAALLFEIAQGPASPWAGYIQSLPTHEKHAPLFWTPAERACLVGTEIDGQVERDERRLRDDYEKEVAPIVERFPHLFLSQQGERANTLPGDDEEACDIADGCGGQANTTNAPTPNKSAVDHDALLDLFRRCSTLVSSRAFHVDPYHEDAMVPLADIFNHVVAENVHLESDPDVCMVCGERTGMCEHYVPGSDESDEGDESDLASDVSENEEVSGTRSRRKQKTKHALVSGDDICSDTVDDMDDVSDDGAGQDGDENEDEWATESEAGSHDSHGSDSASTGSSAESHENSSDDDEDVLEMRVIRPVNEGEELFNTYGMHSNAGLLIKYGFTLPPSEVVGMTTITVSLAHCLMLAVQALGLSESTVTNRLSMYISNRAAIFKKLWSSRLGDVDDEELEEEVGNPDVNTVFFGLAHPKIVCTGHHHDHHHHHDHDGDCGDGENCGDEHVHATEACGGGCDSHEGHDGHDYNEEAAPHEHDHPEPVDEELLIVLALFLFPDETFKRATAQKPLPARRGKGTKRGRASPVGGLANLLERFLDVMHAARVLQTTSPRELANALRQESGGMGASEVAAMAGTLRAVFGAVLAIVEARLAKYPNGADLTADNAELDLAQKNVDAKGDEAMVNSVKAVRHAHALRVRVSEKMVLLGVREYVQGLLE